MRRLRANSGHSTSSWSTAPFLCRKTAKCPLFLLTGEYDYSCTPEDTLAIARSVKGAEATIMKGMGHFPMSEDPASFLEYLLPILNRIKADARQSTAA